MKKMIKRIRAAKTWQERAEIARDEQPRTSFDAVFENARLAGIIGSANHSIARQSFEELGGHLAWIILNEKTQVLHDMASALALWKRHNPKPNYDLEVLFGM